MYFVFVQAAAIKKAQEEKEKLKEEEEKKKKAKEEAKKKREQRLAKAKADAKAKKDSVIATAEVHYINCEFESIIKEQKKKNTCVSVCCAFFFLFLQEQAAAATTTEAKAEIAQVLEVTVASIDDDLSVELEAQAEEALEEEKKETDVVRKSLNQAKGRKKRQHRTVISIELSATEERGL